MARQIMQWGSLKHYVRHQSCDYLYYDRNKLLLLASIFYTFGELTNTKRGSELNGACETKLD